MKVLVGEISSYKAIVIARYLNENYPNIDLFTFDNRRYTEIVKTKFSNSGTHFLLKKSTVESYVQALAQIIENHKIGLFLPIHSDYIGEILKQKCIFGNSLSYLGGYKAYQKLHEKDTLQLIAEKLGIDTPKNYQNLDSAEVPFVAKPVEGSSSKGVHYFYDDEAKKSFECNDDYVYQEYIEGFGCGYSVYAENGDILVGYGHKRLAEYPIKGGSSVYRTGFFVNKMKEIANKILKKVGWSGFAMFEFKYTNEGRLVLIEVNPRIWGSFNQGLQNGANYFEPILGEVKEKASVDKKNNTYLSPQIYWVLIQYATNLNLSPAFTFFKNCSINKADISAYKDFRGWLSVILRSVF